MRNRFWFIDTVFESFITQSEIEMKVQTPIKPMSENVLIQGEQALVVVDGVFIHSPSVMDYMFDSVISTTELMQVVDSLAENNAVKDVVFAINSPGGDAHQMNILADKMQRLSSVKNTASVNIGLMASAGYYFGSQANYIFSSDDLNRTGSIGTKTVLYDMSEKAKNEGVKVIPVSTGKFKSMLTRGKEITEEEVAVVQEMVDELQAKFTNAIERKRNIQDKETAYNGLSFSAKKAQELNLIDGLKTVDDTFKFLKSKRTFERIKSKI